MQIEYEATFYDINKEEIRKRLKEINANLIKSEFLQKRTVFNLPGGYDGYRWLRVRDEGDKITMSYKQVGDGQAIESQKELELTISDYDIATAILKEIGCEQKAYQETKRELWQYDKVEICLDEWPWLKPLVEIEGNNEQDVKGVCQRLGFDYSQAIFDSADAIYSKIYKVSREIINNHTPLITFTTENPFVKK